MKYILSLMVLILVALSRPSYAESSFASGNQTLSSSASVYFVIKIPQTMYVRIGSGGEMQSKTASNAANTALSARVQGNSGTMLLSVSKNNQQEAANIQLLKNADTQIQQQDITPVIYTAAMP